jgi:hypothetical protein
MSHMPAWMTRYTTSLSEILIGKKLVDDIPWSKIYYQEHARI